MILDSDRSSRTQPFAHLEPYIPDLGQPDAPSVQTLLDLPETNDLDLEGALRRGLPYKSIVGLANTLGLSVERTGETLGINRANLYRRKQSDLFTSSESDALYRAAVAIVRATSLFESDAVQWLQDGAVHFGGRTPLEVAIGSSLGCDMTLRLIGQLEDGVYP